LLSSIGSALRTGASYFRLSSLAIFVTTLEANSPSMRALFAIIGTNVRGPNRLRALRRQRPAG